MTAVGYVGENGEYPSGGCCGGSWPPKLHCGRCWAEVPGLKFFNDPDAHCDACGWKLYEICPACRGAWPRFPGKDALKGHPARCAKRGLRRTLLNLLRMHWEFLVPPTKSFRWQTAWMRPEYRRRWHLYPGRERARREEWRHFKKLLRG